ncbi:hypothetical protein NYY92_09470, partial [Acinetobacter baumannii]|nr:hypothetical protein [Acinetobacter baumannii]
MATNWNAVLANVNNSADILAILRKVLSLLELKVDGTTVDEVLAQLEKVAADGQITIEEALETLKFLDQKIDERTSAFNDAIEAAAAAGAGANGWTANLVAYDGSTQDIFNDKQKVFNRPNISVFNFGAKGDKVTDDILALEAARDYAAANDGCGWIPPVTAKHQDGVVSDYAFRITRTLFIPAKLDFIMDSPILWDGPADQPVVVIGSPTPANKSQFSEFNRLKIWVQNKNTAPWGTPGSVGVWCYPLQNCRIDFKNVFGFDTGVVLNADKQGFSYNHIKIGELRGNRVGIDWRTTNGGWLNENTFYKGRIASTPVPPGKEAVNRYGVISSSGGFNTQNNKWINPCFELGYDTNDESIPIVLDNASGNEFIGIRAEAHKKWIARFTGTSDNNIITSDYGLISSTVSAVNMGRDFQAIDDQTTY